MDERYEAIDICDYERGQIISGFEEGIPGWVSASIRNQLEVAILLGDTVQTGEWPFHFLSIFAHFHDSLLD